MKKFYTLAGADNSKITKEELEKLVQQVKSESLEAERKSADYYQQLLRATENFQIIQSEQKLLS